MLKLDLGFGIMPIECNPNMPFVKLSDIEGKHIFVKLGPLVRCIWLGDTYLIPDQQNANKNNSEIIRFIKFYDNLNSPFFISALLAQNVSHNIRHIELHNNGYFCSRVYPEHSIKLLYPYNYTYDKPTNWKKFFTTYNKVMQNQYWLEQFSVEEILT